MQRMISLAVVLCGMLWLGSGAARAQDAAERIAAADDAQAALAEFKELRPPQFDRDRQGDQEYQREFQEQWKAWVAERSAAARAFYDRFPDHPAAGKIMHERWRLLPMIGQRDVVEQETAEAIENHPTSPVAAAARFARAATILDSKSPFETKLEAVNEFVQNDPEDPRGGDLLVQLASWHTEEPTQKRQLLDRVRAAYPESRAAKAAEGRIRQMEGVGKPFDLSFTDLTTGRKIDMSDLRGKVVVVDFWATWCGPCIADMPKMKALYEQYQPKGVEFIGVSLDGPEEQGGLEALRSFIDEHDIPWPQYYQGGVWEGEFSSSWGINAIPAIFVIDANGNLRSTEARQTLEELITELIAERDGSR